MKKLVVVGIIRFVILNVIITFWLVITCILMVRLVTVWSWFLGWLLSKKLRKNDMVEKISYVVPTDGAIC